MTEPTMQDLFPDVKGQDTPEMEALRLEWVKAVLSKTDILKVREQIVEDLAYPVVWIRQNGEWVKMVPESTVNKVNALKDYLAEALGIPREHLD